MLFHDHHADLPTPSFPRKYQRAGPLAAHLPFPGPKYPRENVNHSPPWSQVLQQSCWYLSSYKRKTRKYIWCCWHRNASVCMRRTLPAIPLQFWVSTESFVNYNPTMRKVWLLEAWVPRRSQESQTGAWPSHSDSKLGSQPWTPEPHLPSLAPQFAPTLGSSWTSPDPSPTDGSPSAL